MKLHLKIALLTVLAIAKIGQAQDIHFSQPDYAPMSLNPSLTGLEGPLRFSLNYRNQWPLVGASYNTVQASADIKFGDHDPLRPGFLSLGLLLYSDMQNGGSVMNNKANLSLSYQFRIDDDNYVGAGLYFGFGQRSLGAPDGKWASQYDQTLYTYDPAINSGEDAFMSRQSFGYGDAGLGVNYQFDKGETSMNKNNRRALTAGLALYHLNRPSYSFAGLNEEKLPIRYSLFVNGFIGIRGKRNSFQPGVYFNYQKGAYDLQFGSYYSYLIQEGSKITMFRDATSVAGGLFYRWNDALILKGYMQVKKFKFGLAYDVNISRLSPSSKTVGGFEMFITYNTRYSKKYKGDGTL